MFYEVPAAQLHLIGALLEVLALAVGLAALRAAFTLAAITVFLFFFGQMFLRAGGF